MRDLRLARPRAKPQAAERVASALCAALLVLCSLFSAAPCVYTSAPESCRARLRRLRLTDPGQRVHSATATALNLSMVLPWLIVGASAAAQMRRREQPDVQERERVRALKKLQTMERELSNQKAAFDEKFSVRLLVPAVAAAQMRARAQQRARRGARARQSRSSSCA